MIENRLVCVGKVAKVHGIKGELKLFAYSGEAAGLCRYRELYLAAAQTEVAAVLEKEAVPKRQVPGWFRIVRCRPQGKYTLVVLEGVENRDSAQALVGLEAHIDEKDLGSLAEDEFYWHQLLGLTVVTDRGEEVGTVASLFSTGAHDLLVVRDKGREIFIPAVKEFITGIDPVAGKVTIAPIPGLLELNS